jgi:glycogen phosphorylase
MRSVTRWAATRARVSRLSIVGEGEDPVVHMASLGIVGSHKVNGVAQLHSDLIKKTLFKDFSRNLSGEVHQ